MLTWFTVFKRDVGGFDASGTRVTSRNRKADDRSIKYHILGVAPSTLYVKLSKFISICRSRVTAH